jgi:lysophospholipase L1-like esterase
MPGVQSDWFGVGSLEGPAFEVTAPLVTTSLLPVATMQALWLLSKVPFLPEPEGPHEGFVGGQEPALRVLFVGDSSVVGVGVSHTNQAIGASFARAWRDRTGRAVYWRQRGEYGATVRGITERVVPTIEAEPVDLVVVGAGTNDIMKRTPARRFGPDLRALVRGVRDRVGHAPVFMCQLPPIWSFPVLPEPLRSWAGVRRQQLDRVQRRTVASLPDTRLFSGIDSLDPTLFAEDGFHPGPSGYAYWADRLCETWADRGVLPILRGAAAR